MIYPLEKPGIFFLEFLSKHVFTFFRNISYIVLLTKSERVAERLLESSTKYLEETLKLRVNRKRAERSACSQEQHRKPERMAVPPDTDVYLETRRSTGH